MTQKKKMLTKGIADRIDVVELLKVVSGLVSDERYGLIDMIGTNPN